MSFDLDEAQADPDTAEAGAEGEVEASAEGDIIGDLAADTGPADEAVAPEERVTATVEEIYAVQQIYALRINRVELSPSVGFSVNDQFVSHPSVGLGLNYWWTNVLAIGVNFNWYQGLESESDLNFFARRSTRLAIPITEYQLGANLNFTYVPLYGKFGMFNEYIFQWDAYIVGGVGVMRTRPVPVIDPEVRNFDFDWRIAFNLGVGIRIFITRWLAIYGELRDYAYLEELEALEVAPGSSEVGAACPAGQRCDEATWTQDSPSLTNNVTAHIGLTIFIPFEFDYDLPR
ncbi:MAG: outer membrane beta-barrel domain-containing protein [Myxococcales bacterium]|nr:outer membrane beta-barrel domain-containing protein [Myxococcales bacterium]